MHNTDTQALAEALYQLLPADGSNLGNATLLRTLQATAEAQGQTITEEAFQAARQHLLDAGRAVKGKGRGGATGRGAGGAVADAPAEPEHPTFTLDGGEMPAELPFETPKPARKTAPKATAPADSGAPQVLSYRHSDRRKNNPEVGLVNEDTDPEQPKKVWAYDPHLDPVLNFDSGRAELETLIDDALASGDQAVMRAALEELKRRGSPYLQWTGKAERTSFEVDTVSLHVHERIDPMSILSAVRTRMKGEKAGKAADKGPAVQASLFEAPFEALPLRNAIDFYKHDKGWANRLVSGDSLQVMNSLLVKEGMAGQVQMIYIDPPYGIKYGSNFQPFVNKRDVKDRSDADLTQEPEMIKAFRDTWELGIHSYLTYLRDRLLLSRDLLSEAGSIFIQISDENLHHIREICDEIFGVKNFLGIIIFRKTTGQSGNYLPDTNDYIIWYGKSHEKTKFQPLYQERAGFDWVNYDYVRSKFGAFRKMTKSERNEPESVIKNGGEIYRRSPLTSASSSEATLMSITFQGDQFDPGKGGWKTNSTGFSRLLKSYRLESYGKTLSFRRQVSDFPYFPHSNTWTDTASGGYGADKVYVVQTNIKVIERCILMTTEPGDLVIDPTCGSGTTAFAAEKWGRRWITCDTSRVAVTLAKQRLMTASFDYFELAYPHEGLKGGFIYKTVPHITLKSIAQNADIDAIHDRMHPAITAALSALNIALSVNTPAQPLPVTEGVRKGQKLALGQRGGELLEWEVPFPGDDGALPAGWPEVLRAPFEAFHTARQRMQAEMDRSIAAQAENETLYDQPEKNKNKLRITGPFTVEAVPFPTVLSLESAEGGATTTPSEDLSYQTSIARSGETGRQQRWRDELLKTGIRGKGGQMLRFAELETMAGTTCLHASGTLADTGERIAVSFGPEHGALEQRQVEHALGEAAELFPRPKMIVFCAFAFDPEAAKDIDGVKGITALKAQMNTDLLTDDLKKNRSSNQSFWLMGQPDVTVTALKDGQWQVEVNGFDYFDTVKGELVSGGKAKIAMWSLDTDYDGRSLFPHQVFFPMAGKDEGWKKLKATIRAELDESLLSEFHGTKSLPFEAGQHHRAAVKIVDDRGIESLKILTLSAPSAAGAN